MEGHSQRELAEAVRVIGSLLDRCRRAQGKFPPGTPQRTLLDRRIGALLVAGALLEGRGGQSRQALEAALPPIASVIRKCRAAQGKYPPGTAQYARFRGILTAMGLARDAITAALARGR